MAQVNVDDMLTVTPGGIVRVKNNAAIQPLMVPQVANQAFPMLGYMDEVQQKRTGVTETSKDLTPISCKTRRRPRLPWCKTPEPPRSS